MDVDLTTTGNLPVTTPQQTEHSLEITSRASRTAALVATPRWTIQNLGHSVSKPLENSIAETLTSAAAKIHEAVDKPSFRTFIQRALSEHGHLDAAQTKLIFPPDADATVRIDALVVAAHRIVDNGVSEFNRQSDGLQAKGLALEDREITLYKLATHPKIAGAPVREFAEQYVADEKRRNAVVGIIRTAIKEALGATLATEGYTLREQGTSQRQIVNIQGLHLPYFRRPDDNPLHEKFDAVRLALACRNQDPAAVRDFLLAINEVPRMPLGPLREDQSLQLTNRFQRALATLLIRHPEDRISEAHLKTVAIVKDMFADARVLFHPYKNENDAAIVDVLYRAAKDGRLTIAAASCPNYSGTIQIDPKTNTQRWEYDFQQLGDNVGFVAERGSDYVQAWHSVLAKHLGAENVTFVHYEGTFEVANGFKSNTPDGSGDLSYAEAVSRLERSGLAVQAMYAERYGIPLTPRLTSQVIADPEFIHRKEERAAQIVAELETSPRLKAIADFIIQGRIGLYSKWFPIQEGETDEQYISRIVTTKVPENIAEYELLAEILQSSGPNTLVLAFDSPIMGEVYGYHRLPVISGQGAKAAGYLGA